MLAPPPTTLTRSPARDTPPAARARFRPDIQGLRALAVALVVLNHAGVPRLDGGFVGVDVFFVVSGFVITQVLLSERERSGATSLAAFYARRARRILPAATLVLVFTVVASRIVLGPLPGAQIADDGAWTAVFLANIHFAVEETRHLGQDLGPNPLAHYWSLAVEEQFYLVWPLLLAFAAHLAPRERRTAMLAALLAAVCVASFTWCVVQTAHDPTWAYFSPLTRAWELGVGALLAVAAPALARSRPGHLTAPTHFAGLLGLAAIVAAAVLYDAGTTFPGVAVALPVLGTALVIAAGTAAPRAASAAALGWRPLQWLGDRSYSLYLWHWSLLAIAGLRLGADMPLAQDLAWVGVAVVAASLTFRLVEDPLRRAPALVGSPRRSLALGGGLVLVALIACLV